MRKEQTMVSGDVEDLLRISDDILEGIRTRDRTRLERHLLPTFIHVNELGRRDERSAFLSAILAGEHRIERLSFETISVATFGGMAIVSGVQRAAVILPSGETVEGRTAFTDVFLRGPHGWKLQAATSAELGDATPRATEA
jgi:hypothetical protein